jgi:hypothetical protein
MDFEEVDLAQYRIPDSEDADFAPITDVRLLTPKLIDQYVLRKIRPKTLNLTCGRSECDSELHTFRPLGIDLTATGVVPCTKCGTELTGWNPTKLKYAEPDMLFAMLQREWIRHFFFHLPLTDRVTKFAYKNGRQGLAEIAGNQLRTGRMIGYSPRWDAQQTAMLRGTIVHWARHAVACCCRRCIAYWHGIPMSAELSEGDVLYFQQLIVRYIDMRLPELQERPMKKGATASRPQLLRKVS